MKLVSFLDEKWLKNEDLKISAFDISVLRGFGIFDFLRTYRHQPFMLTEHIDRLFKSAKYLGMIVPYNKEEIKNIILEGIEKNKKQAVDFAIRIVVTGGVGIDSVTPGKHSLLIIFSPLQNYPKSYYEKGVKIITYQEKRVIAEAKSLNYLVGVVALGKAKKQKAIEAIYKDEKGKLYEGTTSNFFVVMNNTIITPKNEILMGVTRNVLLKLAKKQGIKLVEKDIYYKDISKCKEAFITASNKEIMPVVQVDDKKIGQGKVGPVTKKLIEGFNTLTSSYVFSY